MGQRAIGVQCICLLAMLPSDLHRDLGKVRENGIQGWARDHFFGTTRYPVLI
jgi:hypothetical protein